MFVDTLGLNGVGLGLIKQQMFWKPTPNIATKMNVTQVIGSLSYTVNNSIWFKNAFNVILL